MEKPPSPILIAVRAALIATTPAGLATGVGITHGLAAELIARCERGREVAVCAEHAEAEQPELHREEIVLPPLPQVITPPTGRVALTGIPPTILQSDHGQPLGTPLPLLTPG
jgi:hypothetical protein